VTCSNNKYLFSHCPTLKESNCAAISLKDMHHAHKFEAFRLYLHTAGGCKGVCGGHEKAPQPFRWVCGY